MNRRWLVGLSALCSGGVLWSFVLICGLLAGVRLLDTGIAVGMAAALGVPGCIAGVIVNRLSYRTAEPQRRPWSLVSWVPPHVPHWAAMGAGVLFFGFWLAVVIGFAGLDEHGGRSEVQVINEQQISLGVLGAVAVGGVFLTGALLTHEDQVIHLTEPAHH